jgi:hypothetical protein
MLAVLEGDVVGHEEVEAAAHVGRGFAMGAGMPAARGA